MRSTLLNTLERHCPLALDFAEQGKPYTRDVYAVGVAAHAVLQRFAEVEAEKGDIIGLEYAEALARGYAVTLATKVRDWDGNPEPPMRLADAESGAALAVSWYRAHGIPVGGRAEAGFAVGSSWQAMPYGRDAHYRGILDLIWIAEDIDDEDRSPPRVLFIRDYKTAWRDTDPTSVQLRGQVLLAKAWAEAKGEDIDAIEAQIGNLRTRQITSHRIWLNADGRDELLTWRSDIDRRIRVAAALVGPDGTRPARPGDGCSGCPWLRSCPAAAAVALSDDPAELARAWLVTRAVQDDREERLREAAADAAIRVDDVLVGYHGQASAVPAPDAPARIVRAWWRSPTAEHQQTEAHALVTALDPGATAIRSVIKEVLPGKGPEVKAARAALEAEMLTQQIAPRFGVTKIAKEKL